MITATSTTDIPVQAQVQATFPKLSAAQLADFATRTALGAVCILAMICALHPDLRNGLRSTLQPDTRKVVSTATAHLAGDARSFTIAKVKTREALTLEIYETLDQGQQKLVEKIALADARDGYFDFNGRASNLAIDDINGDGRPEILAPTFDNNMVGHLNVFNFDPETNTFAKMTR